MLRKPSMVRRPWTQLVGVFTVLLVLLAPTFATLAAAETIAVVPFTVYERYSYRDASGRETTFEQRTYAVRSDGSDVRVVDRYIIRRDEWSRFRVINDVAAMKTISLDLFTESATTYPMDAGWAQFQRKKTGTPCASVAGERDKILGYEVFRELSATKGPKGETAEMEMWKAPKLNCYPLRVTARLKTAKGELEAENVQEALAVVPGEPDPMLFFVPSHYRERPPSQVISETHRRKGGPAACPECASDPAKHWDAIYEQFAAKNAKSP
jgi:hypothetical protein